MVLTLGPVKGGALDKEESLCPFVPEDSAPGSAVAPVRFRGDGIPGDRFEQAGFPAPEVKLAHGYIPSLSS